jgi:flagellar hook-basal body complex protein FliE
MAIQVLSSEEVFARMRDVVARASALQTQVQQTGLSPSQALANLNRPSSLTSGSASSEGKLDFQEVLKEAVRGVSDAQQTAQSKAQAYQLGDDKVSLEDVMISMQRANLAMQGMVQVRNRLVEAYREVINMQV